MRIWHPKDTWRWISKKMNDFVTSWSCPYMKHWKTMDTAEVPVDCWRFHCSSMFHIWRLNFELPLILLAITCTAHLKYSRQFRNNKLQWPHTTKHLAIYCTYLHRLGGGACMLILLKPKQILEPHNEIQMRLPIGFT